MKKIVIILAVAVFALTANAGLWTTIKGAAAPVLEPDAFYQLETVGQNVRVYEWTTQTEPKMKCTAMFVESNNKSPQLQCIKLDS